MQEFFHLFAEPPLLFVWGPVVLIVYLYYLYRLQKGPPR